MGVFRSRGKGDATGRAWIGVDIGKDFHWAIDETGREMLSRRVENEYQQSNNGSPEPPSPARSNPCVNGPCPARFQHDAPSVVCSVSECHP